MDLCHTIQYWIVFVLTQLSWIPLYLSYLLAKLIMGRNPYFFFICMQCGRLGFDPWVRKIPWGREWLCTPVFLPGESQGQRSLAGYCLRVRHNWATNTFTFTAQSCPTLCNPMDCSPPGSSVHEVFQARILEWVAISFSRGSSQPRDWNCVSWVSCIGSSLPLAPSEESYNNNHNKNNNEGLLGT